MHAPVRSILRHTATALHVAADKLTGTARDDLLQRAQMLTDARKHVVELEEAVMSHMRWATPETLRNINDALNRVRGEA